MYTWRKSRALDTCVSDLIGDSPQEIRPNVPLARLSIIMNAVPDIVKTTDFKMSNTPWRTKIMREERGTKDAYHLFVANQRQLLLNDID